MKQRSELAEIALKSLHACYSDGNILASPTHFSDFWARDTFWALPGLISTGSPAELTVAKENLELFARYQRKDGKIPRKVALDLNVFKYLFGKTIKRRNPAPVYYSSVPPLYSMDSESLFVIAFCEYAKQENDRKWLVHHVKNAKLALDWNIARMQNNLLKEYVLGNWMDTVFKFGFVLYTNALFAKALCEFVLLIEKDGLLEDDELQHYKSLSDSVSESVVKAFWNGSFLDDVLSNSTENSRKQTGVFDTAGNVVACYFNVINKEKQQKIAARLKDLLQRTTLLPTVSPHHKPWKINPIVSLFGIGDYHNGVSWLWVDLLAVSVISRFDTEFASQYLSRIERITRRNNEIGETYFNDGSVYKKRFWESARPFAWASGLCLKVLGELKKYN